MNKELFKKKIENIHKNMMECHRDSQQYASVITGSEREIFHRELLSKILPTSYRVGAGTIVDSNGKETGQVDAVIELPLSLSFPIASNENRLYIADTVGIAFEIKSDLNVQWNDALAKVREIKALNRKRMENGAYEMGDTIKIPTFVIGFKGPKKLDSIFEKMNAFAIDAPDGIFVIESGIFYGRVAGTNCVHEAEGISQSVLAFISCIYKVLNQYAHSVANLDSYIGLFDSSTSSKDMKTSCEPDNLSE